MNEPDGNFPGNGPACCLGQGRYIAEAHACLQEGSYAYAGWAAGVAKNDSLTGILVTEFLEESTSRDGTPMDMVQIGQIKTDMALACYVH